MDELSLLEADTTVEDAVSASNSLPAPDFTGSLDYIDSLASRRALSLSQRDASSIAAGVSSFDYLSPLIKPAPGPDEFQFSASADFRPLRDGRTFSFERSTNRPAALVRSSSTVVAPYNFPPGWRNPLDPSRDPRDLERTLIDIERRVRRPGPFSFKKPSQTVICLKRKIRRAVLGSLGFPSMRPWIHPRRNYWSRVFC